MLKTIQRSTIKLVKRCLEVQRPERGLDQMALLTGPQALGSRTLRAHRWQHALPVQAAFAETRRSRAESRVRSARIHPPCPISPPFSPSLHVYTGHRKALGSLSALEKRAVGTRRRDETLMRPGWLGQQLSSYSGYMVSSMGLAAGSHLRIPQRCSRCSNAGQEALRR